jgi:hypothetical protein
MTDLVARSLDDPEQTHSFDHGKGELVTVAGSLLGRFTFEPGWRWSESVKQMAGTDSCETHHVGFALSGHLHVKADDGSELDVHGGEAYNIPPGHDGWVVGDERFVGLEFVGLEFRGTA